MKLISATALLAGVILLAACAAQPTALEIAQSAQADAAAQFDPETLEEIRLSAETISLPRSLADSEVVCQRVQRVGSHMRRQVCLTRAEWRRQSEEAQEWMRSDGQQGAITEIR